MMDFEGISRNLSSSMDAHNITALLISLIAEFGRKTRTNSTMTGKNLYPSNSSGAVVNKEVDDDAKIILAHNLTSILLRNYQHDASLLDDVLKNLKNEEIRWKEEANRRLSDLTFNVIIPIYILVIAIGFFGNLLVVTAAIRKKTLRTPRNAFIINLAVSDILLCLVTMPLTLVEIVNDHWPLGDSVVSCKVAGGFQAVSVFVSTISITVIALDRYQLIVYPAKDLLKSVGATVVLVFIWFLGFLLASPIFMVRTIKHHDLNSPKRASDLVKQPSSYNGGISIDYCYEKWPVAHGQAFYSAFTLMIQYTLPILIISVLHTKIGQRLRTRHTAMEVTIVQDTQKRIKEAKRLRRRHQLLIAIALVFSITWLPLNVLNMLIDIQNPFKHPDDEEKMIIIYAVCHLFGMSSACANPFLYGWFNCNFRSEFIKILRAPLRIICCRNEHFLPSSQITVDTAAAEAVVGSLSSVSVRSSMPAFPEQIGNHYPDPSSTRIDTAEQGYTAPLFSSLNDVEMIDDVEICSPTATNHSLTVLWKGDDNDGSMETHV